MRRVYQISFALSLIFCITLVPLYNVRAQDSKFFPASDPAFYYYGRTRPGNEVLWSWPASGLRVAYVSSPHVRIKLNAINAQNDEPSKNTPRILYYRIDNGKWKRLYLGAGSEDLYPLEVPGDSRTHALEVVKASEGMVIFKGLMLEPFGTLQPTGSGKAGKIEFIGDSITAGFRIFGTASYDIPEHHDAKSSYAWITGDRTKSEVREIAITGRGMVHNFGLPPGDSKTMPAYYPFLHRESGDGNDWAAWQPGFVVINLGTNDMTPPFDSDPGAFQNAYTAFLASVRNYNPGAVIIALQPFGLNYGRVAVYPDQIKAAVQSRRDAGDTRVTYVNTRGWLGRSDFIDGVHLRLRGHTRAAARLASVIRSLSRGVIPPSKTDLEPSDDGNAPAVVSNEPTNPPSNSQPVQTSVECAGAQPTRLVVNTTARVIVDGMGPSPMRNTPGGKLIANVPEGTLLKITNGPQCYFRAWFWIVELPDGRTGWMEECDHSRYYVEPA